MIRLQNILKASLQDVLRMSWRPLEDVFKTSWRCLEDVFADVLKTSWQDVLKMSLGRLEDVFKTSSRRLEDVLKTFLQDVLKTYGQDEYIGLDQDVFWRRMTKANIFVLIKTSPEVEDKRRLQDVFKTSSSRRMFPGCIHRFFGRALWKKIMKMLNISIVSFIILNLVKKGIFHFPVASVRKLLYNSCFRKSLWRSIIIIIVLILVSQGLSFYYTVILLQAPRYHTGLHDISSL